MLITGNIVVTSSSSSFESFALFGCCFVFPGESVVLALIINDTKKIAISVPTGPSHAVKGTPAIAPTKNAMPIAFTMLYSLAFAIL